MIRDGDEITIVVHAGKETIRAQVRGYVSDESPYRVDGARRFAWETPWQATGFCYEADEGITWARGYLEDPGCQALLVAYAFGRSTTQETQRQQAKVEAYGVMYGRKGTAK